MILTPHKAKQGICKAATATTLKMSPSLKTLSCEADDCVAYWRWFDADKDKGYCALGGKPEY